MSRTDFKIGKLLMIPVVVITSSYLLGCINTGYYLVRLLTGQDIRTTASGGTGSRNVGRLLGAKGFVITLVGDAGKGVLAVWLALHSDTYSWLPYAALLAAIAGHIWPLQLAWRGGKGFATFAGGMILLDPQLLLAGFLLSLLFLAILRRTTMSGLLALACSPVIMAIGCARSGLPWWSAAFALYCLIAIIVLFAHRSNIRRDFFSHNRAATGRE
jgi:glycerol-3-phosphate acyltransferase PlsY